MFGDHDSARFLKYRLVSPVRIQLRQVIGNAIVFPQQYDVQNRQLRILIASRITCKHTLLRSILVISS